jgi:hypothetical protein
MQAGRRSQKRRALIPTQKQTDRIVEEGVRIDVMPAWRWLSA